MFLGLTGLLAVRQWLVAAASFSWSRAAQVSPDRIAPRLAVSQTLTGMTAAQEILWAAVGGLEAAYLMNPDPYNNSNGSASLNSAALEEWMAAALDQEAATAAPPAATPVEASDTLTQAVFLPNVVRAWGAPEARALWVTRYDYTDAASIGTIMTKAAGANFNIILFQVRANGDAYYRSGFEPWSARISGTLGQDPGWDPLAAAVEAAHQMGLELHAYLNVYPAWIGETPPISGTTPLHMYHALTQTYGNDWLQWDDEGPMTLNTHYLWASPGHPAITSHIISVCRDIVNHYAVDGLHLDNVRYAGAKYSQDPTSLARYAAISNTMPYSDWQRLQVTELVSRLYSDVLTGGLTLSAAVWPYFDAGYNDYYQDSLGWLNAGEMDAIAPMLYAGAVLTDNAAYEAQVAFFVQGAAGRQVWAGITGDYASFEAIADRIQIARWNGATGQAIFRYALIDANDYWDDLRNGPYSASVAVPEMPWK
ncbi:MAG: glycoside hydrolase family 10 protein [Chloroflexota bacterium]